MNEWLCPMPLPMPMPLPTPALAPLPSTKRDVSSTYNRFFRVKKVQKGCFLTESGVVARYSTATATQGRGCRLFGASGYLNYA